LFSNVFIGTLEQLLKRRLRKLSNFFYLFLSLLSILWKKITQENGMTPFMGSWLSSFILTPLAVLLTYRANDIGLINMDVILAPFKSNKKNIPQN
jgi:lipopolysaccharide export system permease protein